ncbi:hypothetical protein [Leifsonia sp. McL0608]|uniref:hypothetical protein n=1 Tax=Leifsonia sp. McL0608 TaxID=3143537 RepID=UPI003D9C0575
MKDQIDDVYRNKYAGSPYLPPMVTARTRAATVGSTLILASLAATVYCSRLTGLKEAPSW